MLRFSKNNFKYENISQNEECLYMAVSNTTALRVCTIRNTSMIQDAHTLEAHGVTIAYITFEFSYTTVVCHTPWGSFSRQSLPVENCNGFL